MYFIISNSFDSRICERLHFYKPLFREYWFNYSAAPLAMSNTMVMILYFYHKSQFGQITNYLLSGLVSVHASIFSTQFVNSSIIIHDSYHRKLMSLPYLKIIDVMCRSYFNRSCSKIFIYIIICDYRNFLIQ